MSSWTASRVFLVASALAAPHLAWLLSGAAHLVLALVLAQLGFLSQGEPAAPAVVDVQLIEQITTEPAFDPPLEAEVYGGLDAGGDPGGSSPAPALVSVDDGDLVSSDLDEMGLGTNAGAGIGTGTGNGTGSGSGNGGGNMGFFGTGSSAETVVYVVDGSGSMEGHRMSKAKQELLKSIARLKPPQKYYVIFFNSDTYPLFYPRPAQELILATSQNLVKTRRWVGNYKPGSQTQPDTALLLAMSLKPQVIFFLTDGEIPPTTREIVKEGNVAKSVINTIALHGRDGESLLKAIAEDHGGVYKFVR